MSDKRRKNSYSSLTGFKRAVPIILAAVAAFIGLCFVTQNIGALGPAISSVLLGLFSWGAYLVPFLIALHAIFYPSDVGEKRILSRTIFSVVTLISASALSHGFTYWNNEGISFRLRDFYASGLDCVGGGVIGGTVGYGIIAAIGSVGLIIVAVAVLAIYCSYFFASGKRGLGKALYYMLKGIVFFLAAVEGWIKGLFKKAKKSKADKKCKAADENSRKLMDDEFFDVDNGIEHLEINELGISEHRDRASIEANPTLADTVHHASEVSAEENVAPKYSAEGYDYSTAEPKRTVYSDFGTEGAVYEDRVEREPSPVVYEIKLDNTDDSADAIFTEDFDPYNLATSEKLASKTSSRSLLDEKPTVHESISELGEEDAERARRTAEFERRKAAIVSSRQREDSNDPTPAEPVKTVEFKEDIPEEIPAVTEEDEVVTVVIDKPTEPTPSPYVAREGVSAVAEPEVSDISYKVDKGAPAVTTEPATEGRGSYGYDDGYTARQGNERTMEKYRRAAGYAVAAADEPVRESGTYNSPTGSYGEAPRYEAPAYRDEPVKPSYDERIGYTSEPVAESYEEPEDVYEYDESEEEVYGSYTYDEPSAEPEFKPYASPSEEGGGLVFEIDESTTEQKREVLETESTIFVDDEGEETLEDVGFENMSEDTPEIEEIPPEKQNPLVAEMRDMFPALREDTEDASEPEHTAPEEIDEPELYETEEDEPDDEPTEDEPPFDTPTAAPKPKAEKPKQTYKNYKKPPLELLGLDFEQNGDEIYQEINENTNTIIETLASFNVMASIKGVDRGPRITRYEVVPAKGVKVNQITHLFDDITLNLAADGIRMEAPIPGKSAIGFEIPNKNPANVRLRELLECEEFINAKSNTFVCIGKDVAGNPVFGDIGKFPHALVAGATGMGKSVCINSLMISMLYKARPDQVKFIMIDPKKVEFRMYSGIPHLLIPVITEAKQAAGALMWAVDEMERRYEMIEKLNIRNIEAYNERQEKDPSIGEHMPKIVIVIDELNDLMMQVRDPVEQLIMRIAQKARAAGIHLIIGTQRPDVKVITGTIKANINTRISCKVTSVVDSRTILEMAGAEKLLNRGDMLFKPVDKTKPIRVQGAFVSDNEVEAIMDFLKSQSEGAQYDEEIYAEINKAAQKCGNKKSGGAVDDDGDDEDDVCGYYNDQKFLDAVELAIRSEKVSTSLLQRKLSIGYGKAAKYIDAMEEIGIVSEPNGQKPREVLITMDQWLDKLSRVDLN